MAIPLFENDEIFKKIINEADNEVDKEIERSIEVDQIETTTSIPDVFRNLPTLSFNRRDNPELVSLTPLIPTVVPPLISSDEDDFVSSLNISYNVINRNPTNHKQETQISSSSVPIEISAENHKIEEDHDSTSSANEEIEKVKSGSSSLNDNDNFNKDTEEIKAPASKGQLAKKSSSDEKNEDEKDIEEIKEFATKEQHLKKMSSDVEIEGVNVNRETKASASKEQPVTEKDENQELKERNTTKSPASELKLKENITASIDNNKEITTKLTTENAPRSKEIIAIEASATPKVPENSTERTEKLIKTVPPSHEQMDNADPDTNKSFPQDDKPSLSNSNIRSNNDTVDDRSHSTLETSTITTSRPDNNKMILTQDSATTTATVDLHNEVVEENIKQKSISSTSSEELLTTSTTTVTTVTNYFSSSSESLQVDNRKVNKSSLTDQLLSAVKAATDKKVYFISKCIKMNSRNERIVLGKYTPNGGAEKCC